MMKHLLSALLMASLCGCSGVVSTRPFGEAPLDLAGQADKWTGTWRSPMGPCAITVADATNGVLAMASTTPKGWGRWSNEIQRIYVRTGGEWTFASMDGSEGTNACYLWGKIANEDGTILWWQPDPAKFKSLVESGALPGTVEKTAKRKKKALEPPILGFTESGDAIYQTPDSVEPQPEYVEPAGAVPSVDAHAPAGDAYTYIVTVGDLESRHFDLIAAASNGVMFDWEHPLVLVKESGRADLRHLRAAQKRWMREQGK